MSKEKIKTISVDIQRLEQFWDIDLHELEPGEIYPASKLINAIGLQHGTPKLKPWGSTK